MWIISLLFLIVSNYEVATFVFLFYFIYINFSGMKYIAVVN